MEEEVKYLCAVVLIIISCACVLLNNAFSLVNNEFDDANNPESFKGFLRMDKETFKTPLSLVEEDIMKEATDLRTPSTAAEWLNLSQEFLDKRNFTHTLGAKDGQHIVFRASRSTGSAYFNYKGQNSIVLLAVVDANCKFIYIDCGTNGRVSDGGVYQKSTLCHAARSNALNFPEDSPLSTGRPSVPYVFVADAAFPLQKHIMKPFPMRNMTCRQRIFNYRLSGARRVVENAFGILANRWRVLLTTILLSADKVELLTQTCCVLHNFLAIECPNEEVEIDERYRFIYGLAQQG